MASNTHWISLGEKQEVSLKSPGIKHQRHCRNIEAFKTISSSHTRFRFKKINVSHKWTVVDNDILYAETIN